MLEDEYLEVSKELSSLKDKRDELERKLELPHPREYIIECKYDIIKITEKITDLEKKQIILEDQLRQEEQKRLEEERRQKQEELHYKEVYIKLTENMPIFKMVFKISEWSNEECIKYLLDNYTEQQLFRIMDLFNILESSLFDNFIHDFHSSHPPLNILLEKYENKCSFIENLKPQIKNKIKKVEDKWDLKFNGVIRSYYFSAEFIKDFSQEADFESFLLENFPEYVSSHIIYRYADKIDSIIDKMDAYSYRFKYDGELDVYSDYGDIVRYCEEHWEELPEYDKLNSIDIDNFLDSYLSDMEEEISKIVKGDFNYNVDAELPSKRNPISIQTPEYNYKKDEVYEKKVQKYDELIAKKRHEKNDESDNSDCIRNLNENSSIEDIANCYCRYEGFNNWEFDKKNKKIIFKLLRADGKNYLKMKKLEVKKLESWPKTVKK